jgi:hypothetical protein
MDMASHQEQAAVAAQQQAPQAADAVGQADTKDEAVSAAQQAAVYAQKGGGRDDQPSRHHGTRRHYLGRGQFRRTSRGNVLPRPQIRTRHHHHQVEFESYE